MIERTVKVTNRAGIHARPAAMIVQTASRFDSKIILGREGEEINAKSIMGIITLGAGYDTTLKLSVERWDLAQPTLCARGLPLDVAVSPANWMGRLRRMAGFRSNMS